MKSITSYIIEKYKISKNTINDSKKLYIFIPFGWSYDFFTENFNKHYYSILINHINSGNFYTKFEVWFLTEEEIFITLDKKEKRDSYNIYKLPEEYENIYDTDELANKIGDKLDANDLTRLEYFKNTLVKF